MRKINLFMLMILLLIIPTINASISNLGTFKQGNCIILKQTCSSCTYINISSVSYPDGTEAMGQRAMTKTGNEYNYNYCLTSQIGKYIVNGYGDLDGTEEIWVYEFNMSPSGEQISGWLITTIIIAGVSIYMLVYRRNQLIGSILFMLLGLGIWSILGGGTNGWLGVIIFVAGLIGLIYDFVKILDITGKIRSST